ncbi:MAG: hypothetical protein F4Z00_17660 [Acidimicrobiaceae bacterium]|nr:hypothetical protein [Acidimicrobiaceae bacterium]MXY12071.1 hypothetical protein [Acidimicrobiaceae bacterium]MXZ67356.1 hypothetical protein [Acidimicrobiaceae bacterium]MYF33917.1 hypothetical protein [Acidimicrobiaceae bacterium]MYG80194.1 hypothetical protein [Acidimicrobiaceae bacterium]
MADGTAHASHHHRTLRQSGRPDRRGRPRGGRPPGGPRRRPARPRRPPDQDRAPRPLPHRRRRPSLRIRLCDRPDRSRPGTGGDRAVPEEADRHRR